MATYDDDGADEGDDDDDLTSAGFLENPSVAIEGLCERVYSSYRPARCACAPLLEINKQLPQ